MVTRVVVDLTTAKEKLGLTGWGHEAGSAESLVPIILEG